MSAPTNYPRAPLDPEALPCPSCGQVAGKRIKYTWWGGVVGPGILNLTKCQVCGFQFNYKTGLSTKKAILWYNVVVIGISLFALAALLIAQK